MLERALQAPLPPGSTIGILGSGQLGRMLALAAARIGLKTHIYADVFGSACDVAAANTIAPYDDEAALARFAAATGAVTYEFENVPVASAQFLSRLVPLRPAARALEVAQDRLVEKTFIAGLGIAVAPFADCPDPAALSAALARFDTPCILKTRRLGYDGRGQVSLVPGAEAGAALASLNGLPTVLERRIHFEREISVLLVRGGDGTMTAYDCPANTHANGILATSLVPAGIGAQATAAATSIAKRIASALDYVGLLTVELFDLGATLPLDRRFVVNEIAPRVHNSGHWTIEACAISQFENHIRAVAGWPLGSCVRHADAEMRNLIGTDADNWHALAAEPGAALHLYGKGEARPGRKLGHVTRLRRLTAD